MLIRSKRHWATLLAVGLPLVVGGCAGGMGTHGAQKAPEAAAKANANAPRMDALTLADRLKAEGNFSSAASMYQQAAQANPVDGRPLLGFGDCLLAMGNNAEAAQAYGAALALQPNNLDALRGLGHVRILLGQPQFAVAQYQTALKIAPNDTRILNGLGVAQDMMGDHAAAQKSYHQVLTIDPANQAAKNNLALSLALAGDDAGAIKILEDVSKSATATAVNRQNLALLYGVNGQMAQAEQVSRADLPQDAVSRNMAAISAHADAAKKQELLKESLGVELKGRQYAPAAKPITPLTNLAQTSSIEEQPVYMSATQEGDPLPVITTGNAAVAQAEPPPTVVVKTTGKKDGWSDWDEELVDATDVNGTAGTQTAAKPAPSTTSNITEGTADSAAPAKSQTAASQDAGAPRFLSSTKAIADDKAATTPAATPASTPSTPAASSSTTATQMAAVPPTATATTTPEKPAASAGAMSAATPTAAAEKPTASTRATSAATSTAATSSAAAAAAPSASDTVASSMTVTAKSVDVAKVYTVQIASYRSEQEASAGWQTLTAEQADLLGKLPHAVAKADLGAEKGVFYRLQAGSFSDRSAAKALCSDLKDRSVDCMVVEATPATAAPGATQQSTLAPDNSFVIGAR
jgi:Flp pilus assembly protein TadD